MKAYIAVVAIALAAIFVIPSESVTSCNIRCNTGSTTQVCGKSGNTCMRFSNNCAHKLYNCLNSKSYAKVKLSRCRNITVNNYGTCRSSTSSASASVYTLGSPYGSYGSSMVTPIVIRV